MPRWRALPVVCALVAVAAPAPAQITWNFTFADVTNATTTGFDDRTSTQSGTSTLGADRRATMVLVANYLNTQLDARGTINFAVDPSFFAAGDPTLASAGTSYFTNVGGPVTGFQNGILFRQATTGGVGGSVASAEFNFGKTWNTGLTAPTAGQFDLYSTMLHEISHALGFTSLVGSTGQGLRNQALGSPDIYSRLDALYTVGSAAGSPNLISSNAAFNTAQASVADLTGGNLFFKGEFATLANAGTAPKVYAPNPYDGGSSLAHVDSTPAAQANAVMQFSTPAATQRRTYQNFELGMLIDAGWNQYFWTRTSNGNWGDNTAAAAGSPWQNLEQFQGTYSGYATEGTFSPVGTITPNLVLTFTNGGNNSYTSTNNLALTGGAVGDRFLVNRVNLTSTSTGLTTIARQVGGSQVLRFDTTIGVTPEVRQSGTGAVAISHPMELMNAGLTLGGTGTGVVTLSGEIGVGTGQTGGLTKTGTSEFVLTGANTYNGTTTVSAGVLRAANASGSATGTGAVTVSAGGTLAGATNLAAGTAGFVSGDVTVNGTLRPGSATAGLAGQLSFNGGAGQDVAFSTGSAYVWNLITETVTNPGLAYDQVRSNNGANLSLAGGVVTLAFAAGATPNAGESFWQADRQWTIFDVIGGGKNTTQFTSITNGGDYSTVGTFSLLSGLTDGDVILSFVPVPEPGTVLGVVAAGLGLVRLVRRRTGLGVPVRGG